uniref:26S proteasome non-ATPase regulatory subunit 10 (Trinotate prediction) n=1 Tax=Henneguya salminicola TaxID=69463 RepID=A0A6G3MHE0_HENSL
MEPAHLAANEGRLNDLKELYSKNSACIQEGGQRTCLHWACSSGQIEVANWLIDECNVDIDVQDDCGWLPLHVCASAGRTQLVEKLLERGAKTDQLNDNGCTPLHYACSKGHVRIVEILLENGAINNFEDAKVKETPLHRAAAKGFLSIVKLLVENKADVNAKDAYGDPPIVRAAESEEDEIVLYLAEKGANLVSKNKEGVFVYQLISKKLKEKLKSLNLYNIS